MMYHFKIHKEGKGYWAECIELNCTTQADTKQELEYNMAEALNLLLSEPPDSKIIFPPPKANVSGRNIVKVPVDPCVSIAQRIRQLRLQNNLTQMAMKDRLGIKTLSNYQRLENPYKANPQWQTLLLIKKVFPQFCVDDLMT